MIATPANPMKRQARPQRHLPPSEHGEPSSIAWPPGSILKSATRWWMANSMRGRWELARDRSRRPTMCKRLSMPITACDPIDRSVNNQRDVTMFDRSAFVFQPEADAYTCPAGHVIARKQVMRRDSLVLYAASDCAG